MVHTMLDSHFVLMDLFLLSTALIRYNQIMKDVMMAYVELFGKTIQDRVKSETRGDYEKLLLELLEGGVE